MTRLGKILIVNSVLSFTILVPIGLFAFQAKDVPGKTAPTPGPSEKDIAGAKARGLVWVDASTKVYYKGGPLYGKTKRGDFMPEAVARQAGNREEKPADSKK